ncbi:MAG: EamA family transporter, partial [Pseudomonadota bacterium]
PGAAAMEWAALLPLLAALAYAGVVVTGKMLAPLESPGKIAVYVGIYSVPLALVPAIIYWQWSTAQQFLWLLVIGAASGLIMYAIWRALRIGDASQSLPYDFLRLPFAALVAFIMFGQIPEIWTWLGAVVIFASAVFVTYSDTRLAGPTTPAGGAASNRRGKAPGKRPANATQKRRGR